MMIMVRETKQHNYFKGFLLYLKIVQKIILY